MPLVVWWTCIFWALRSRGLSMNGVGPVCADDLIYSCHSHRPIVTSLPPTKTNLFLKYTLYSSFSNITLHPASQNFLVEMRDACARLGTICTSVTCSGIHGMSRLQVWVDLMMSLFGSVTAIGLAPSVIFIARAPAIKKWLVTPKLEIAHLTPLVTSCSSETIFICGTYLKFFCLYNVLTCLLSCFFKWQQVSCWGQSGWYDGRVAVCWLHSIHHFYRNLGGQDLNFVVRSLRIARCLPKNILLVLD